MDVRDKLITDPDSIVPRGRPGPSAAAPLPAPSRSVAFPRLTQEQVLRFDSRPDHLLRETSLDHPSALERDRAIWEYADRRRSEGVSLLALVASQDPDPLVRCSALWALRKVAGGAATQVISLFQRDDHPEVRDWAALFLRELRAPGKSPRETRELRFDSANSFDQTMPLSVAGHAQVLVPGLGRARATLSPLWFESVMGRLLACTRAATFRTELVLEKRLAGYHPDGSHHYQIFRFRGVSRDLGPGVCHHRFEALARHTFYPSGKIEDTSQPPLDDVVVSLPRSALTIRAPVPGDPGRTVVSSVRGHLQGAAFINIQRVLSRGMAIGPGEIQVVNPDHPVLHSLTNTYLFAAFRGKLSDLDGDGCLDVNTERCHGTLAGKLDLDLDGVPDADPYDPYCR